MTTSTLEAYDLITHAALLEQRLTAAAAELAPHADLEEEVRWLTAARDRIARARANVGDLALRVLGLREFEPMRGERGKVLQGEVVDAMERLERAIGTAVSERSPVLEVVYRGLKLPNVRRLKRPDFEKFIVEIEKRLASSYVARMLKDESYADVAKDVAALRSAFEAWRGLFAGDGLPKEEAEGLRAEIEGLADAIELACRQARLLAEAALVTVPELAERSGIFERVKRKAKGGRAKKESGRRGGGEVALEEGGSGSEDEHASGSGSEDAHAHASGSEDEHASGSGSEDAHAHAHAHEDAHEDEDEDDEDEDEDEDEDDWDDEDDEDDEDDDDWDDEDDDDE